MSEGRVLAQNRPARQTRGLLPVPSDCRILVPSDRGGRGAASIAFADGHAEAHTWRQWPKERGICTNPKDKGDLRWLQARLVEP
jgi:prepilin-type processing-associated H-X9-DG protein